jgi:hypothetical protein
MLSRRKEKTTLAAQIAAVGYIIYGTADIKAGNSSVSFVPFFIKQGTDCIHQHYPDLSHFDPAHAGEKSFLIHDPKIPNICSE